MSKEWNLLLHPSFIDSYLEDLNDEERIEVMNYVFCWYKGTELPTLKSKLSNLLIKSTIPLLESKRDGYNNGIKGGAPKGNTNAKKKENNLNNGGLNQLDNGGLKQLNNLNNNNNTKDNNKDYYYHNNPGGDGGFSFESFQEFFPDGKNSFSHHELSQWDHLSTKEKELIFDVTPRYVNKLTNEGKEKYIKSLKNYMKDGFWNTINQFQSRYLSSTSETKSETTTKNNKIGPDGYPEDMYDWMDKVKFD